MANFTPQEIEEMLQAFFDTVGKRQYVGARYVPIFGRAGSSSINWDNSDAYEPLTIVLYNGDSYTSRRYVPAGIDISDTDYWVVTGRYNAQVEHYPREVESFSDRIDGAYDAVNGLRDDVADDYVPFPDGTANPKYGTLGQVLTTLANGDTKWENPVVPSDAQTEAAVDAWLDAHPEATTTVTDGSVTDAKLAQSGGILSRTNTMAYTMLMENTADSKYIRLDTSNQTVTIPRGTLLVNKATGNQVNIASGENKTFSVAQTAINSSAIKVYYDTANSAFVLKEYAQAAPTNGIFMFTIRRASNFDSWSIVGDFPWMVDEYPYGIRSSEWSMLLDTYSRYVNIDTTNNTLTIPRGTLIVNHDTNAWYNIASGQDVTIDISQAAINSSAIKVYYDTSSGQFVLREYLQAEPNAACAYLFSVRRTTNHLTCSIVGEVPWSVNGIPYDIYANDCQLFLGSNNYECYVNLNTVNNTITFPYDTIVVDWHTNTYRILSPSNQSTPRTVDISSAAQASGAIRLYYDISNDTFSTLSFTTGSPLYLVCTIRRGGFIARGYNISADFPWSIDDVPYSIYQTLTTRPKGVKAINHRGWYYAPENTIPGFRASIRHGFSYVECDVEYTADDVPVLLHDSTINRTARNADGTEIATTINIADITYTQAQSYDFGIYKGERYAGTKIPTVNEFFSFCRSTGIHPYVHLSNADTQAHVETVVGMARAHGIIDNCTFISYTSSILEYVANVEPTPRLGLLCDAVTQTVITNAESLQGTDNEIFIDAYDEHLDSTGVELCINAKIPLEVYTTNDITSLLSMPEYVSGFTSDYTNSTCVLHANAMNGA